jgi:LPXTG-motif cell wall-anchored protein
MNPDPDGKNEDKGGTGGFMTRAAIRFVLCGAVVCLPAAVSLAQTSTTTETKKFQVIAVEGNQLVVRLPEGTRELTVPADFRFNVDGKMLSVQELKPGMAGTATITTRTTVTPVTVTEVKNGTVTKALGTSIIVATDGGYKMFSQSDIDKRGVRIMREGQPAQISEFRENDRLTATIITSKPPRVMTEQEVNATLARSTAGGSGTAAPASSTPQTPAATAETPAATSGAAPRTLPKTASPLPVVGLAGLASLAAGVALTVRRRRAAR